MDKRQFPDFQSILANSRWPLIVLAILLFTAYFSIFGLIFGPVFTSDGRRDLAYATAILEFDLDPFRFVREIDQLTGIDHPIPKLFYMSYIYEVSGLRWLLGERWLTGLVIANGFAQAVASTLVLAIVAMSTRPAFAVAVGAIFLVSTFEFFQWVAMSQSDALYIPFVGLILFATVHATTASDAVVRRRFWWIAFVALALSMTIRPTWPPLIATILGAAIMSGVFQSGDARRMIRSYAMWMGLLILGGVLGLFLSAAAYNDPNLIPEGVARESLLHWRQLSRDLIVVGRPETFMEASDGVLGFAKFSFARAVYYFWFGAEGFSPAHRWLNIVTHIPLYVLAVFGAVRSMMPSAPLGTQLRAAGLISIAYILMFDFYHAATVLDFDWRYRAPAYPGLIVLASIGAAGVAAGVTGLWNRPGPVKSGHSERAKVPQDPYTLPAQHGVG